ICGAAPKSACPAHLGRASFTGNTALSLTTRGYAAMTNSHPSAAPLPASVLEALAKYDTPTICNAMEIVAPERRVIGFPVKPLVCPFPDLPPIVGYARTATMRSTSPSSRGGAAAREHRAAYYEYVGTGPGPTISVIQDLDGSNVGTGAFWGEVQSS